MSDDELKAIVLRAISDIAPEADLAHLDPTVDVREQLDIDSMDSLNIMIGIHEATGVDIPEADYPLMNTLNACVAYLARKVK
ncbi:MAG: acyl carrier protein [Deltaproteobacteria bacterium]|nr:acyl carrier protein [Deltaproteobacteria bacterium]